MTIKVQCEHCLSEFELPKVLAGQTVKCTSCGKPVKAKAMNENPAQDAAGDLGGALMSESLFTGQPGGNAPQQPPIEPLKPKGNRGQAGGQVPPSGAAGQGAAGQGAGGFPGAGGTAHMGGGQAGGQDALAGMRQGIAMGTTGNMANESQDDPNLQSRMERLYGIYAGEELQKGKKGKFTVGLGISLAIVLVGVLGGGFVVWRTLGDQLDNGTELVDGGVEGVSEGSVGPIVHQGVDKTKKWTEAGAEDLSDLRMDSGEIFAKRVDDGWAYDFEVRVQPRKTDKSRFGTKMKAVLYRSLEADGEYVQVDAKPVGKVNSATGELVFELHDGSFMDEAGVKNYVFYRLNVLDTDGKRLVDTPVVKYPVMKGPKVRAGRVTWSPMDAVGESDVMHVLFYMDMPGWEDVLMHRISSSKSINELLPEVSKDLQMRVMMTMQLPTHAMISDSGAVSWEEHVLELPVRELEGGNGLSPVGLVPNYGGGEDNVVRMVPHVGEFDNLTVEPRRDGRGNLVGHSVMFKAKVTGELETIDVAYAGEPRDLTVVPFDEQVKLTWDGRGVAATVDTFVDPVGYGVYREDSRGGKKLLAVLDPGVSEYRDTDVTVGDRYRYEVVVVPAGSPNDSSMVKTSGWMSGIGEVEMLVKHRPMVSSSWVTTERGLNELNVVLGRPELVYSGTCKDAIDGMDALSKVLRDAGGVCLIDRARVKDFYQVRDRGGVMMREVWEGKPAHLEFVFVDEMAQNGAKVSLWVRDYVSGGEIKLYECKSGEMSVADVSMAVKRYVEPLKSERKAGAEEDATGRPLNVVVEPLQVADQMRKYYGVGRLTKKLESMLFERMGGVNVVGMDSAGSLDGLGTLMVGGRAWLNNDGSVGMSIRAIDVATGVVLGEQRVNEVGELKLRDVCDWVNGLRVTKVSGQRDHSVLISKEKMISPLHEVWSQMSGAVDARRLPMGEFEKDVVSFGAAFPRDLYGDGALGVRGEYDLLSVMKPYYAASSPLVEKAWIERYAKYIEADFDGYKLGYERLIALHGEGNDDVQLYVRGRPVSGAVNLRGKARVTGKDIVLGSVLPGNEVNGFALDYWREMSEAFYAEPYMMSKVWDEVKNDVSEPMLRGLMHRVVRGRYETLERRLKVPPTLDRYVSAKLLFGMGNRESLDFMKEIARICTFVQRNLDRAKDPRERVHIRNAVLILMYEKDPTTIKKMNDANFRRRMFARGEMTADIMRMFVDATEAAWEWDEDQFQSGIDWREFKWRDVDEMRMITDEKPELFTRAHYEQMRRWMGAPIQQVHGHRMSYPNGEEVEEVNDAMPRERAAEPRRGGSFEFLNN